MLWKNANMVVKGGTAALARLERRRVRTRYPFSPLTFEGTDKPYGKQVAIGANVVGFIGKVHGNGVVVAFPKAGAMLPSHAAMLQSGDFVSVWVDIVNFRNALMVETY